MSQSEICSRFELDVYEPDFELEVFKPDCGSAVSAHARGMAKTKTEEPEMAAAASM